MNIGSYKRKNHEVPRLLDGDAYTIGSNNFESDKAKEKSVYYICARRFLAMINLHLYTKEDTRWILSGFARIIDYLFFTPITWDDIFEADAFLEYAKVTSKGLVQFNYPRELWIEIVVKYGGRIPIQIKSLPDGSVFYPHEPIVEISNLPEGFGVLAAWFESKLLQLWSSTEMTTQLEHWVLYYKTLLDKVYGDTMSDDDKDFTARLMIHNFGDRAGICPQESDWMGETVTLSFAGTDTFAGGYCAWKNSNQAIGTAISVAALAHRNVESYETEFDCFRALYDDLKTNEIGSFVADCNDFFNAVFTYDNEKEMLAPNCLLDLALESDVRGNGKIVVVRPDCYDDITEILTNTGWKLFKILNKNDLVAQYNNSHEIEFVLPLKYFDEFYEGDMYRFYDLKGRLDLLVTPNHKMVCNKKKIFLETAEDSTFYYGKNMKRSGVKINGSLTNLTYLDRLKIAFQADGAYQSNRIDNKTTSIRFNFTKKRKFDRLCDICDRGNFDYKFSKEPSRPNNYIMYVTVNTEMLKDFSWVDLNCITSTWGKEFLEELSYWDSTRRSSTRFKFDTCIEQVANSVLTIASISGVGCTMTKFVDNRKEQFSDVYSLSILMNNNDIGGQSINKEKITYSGRVYCVTVPSGMLLVRRNNKTVISGNSGIAVDQVLWLCRLARSYGLFREIVIGGKTWFGATFLKFIEGDGMKWETMKEINAALLAESFLPWEWGLYGVGGGLRNDIKRDNGSFKYALCAVGNELSPRVKFSETAGKSTLGGPFKLLRDPEAIVNGRTIVLHDEAGVDARVLYYDGTLEDECFGDIMAESNLDIKARIRQQLATMPKRLVNDIPASEKVLNIRLELLAKNAPQKLHGFLEK